ncbi:MAG: sensor histidine kinase [Lacibacter sp.]|nr:sensor histidine kinase [Lacibacter sp.]
MKQLLLYILLFFTASANAQLLMNKDSLLKLIPSVKDDSAGVEFYINLGQQYESNEPELAKRYYSKAGSIGEKVNYKAGVLKYIFNYSFVLNMQGRYDSGLALNQRSVVIARTINNPLLLGKALFNTGTSYRLLTKYEDAAKLYEEGRKIFMSNGDSLLSAQANEILQMLYYQLEDYDKAIAYGEASVKFLRTVDEPVWLGTALSNLGMSYSKKRDYTKAKNVWNEALSIGKAIGNVEMEASQMINLGDLFMNAGDYAILNNYYGKALELYTKLEADEGITVALRGLAIYYFFKKDFSTARDYANQSLKVANENNLLFEKKKTLETLSQIHFSLHELVSGHKYMQEATLLADSMLNDRIRKNTVEFEAKYEIAKKDNQIKLQQVSIKQKNTFNYVLIGSAAAILIISLLSFRNYKHKQKLQQQRISELETEKQLEATEAVLKGEEQERTRLAKDLHDGLGGMLSGIKYSFNNMKGNLVMTPDNAQAFERSMDMLDSSIKEMRRVAHNMMPEALVKFGLDTALKDFCNDVTQSSALQVTYQSVGMEAAAIDQTTAITIYRIVQELLNNTIKHAAAKTAIVQLSKSGEQLSVTVEDDGKGFDASILQASRGIGWTNIQNRVEFLKGKLDVNTAPGKGTSVLIELTAA